MLEPRERLDGLTSLRFVAAAMVVLVHSSTLFDLTLGPTPAYALNTAVSFFLVLSGFLLTYNNSQLEGRTARRRFWLARFARVWPLYAAVLCFCFIARPEGLFLPQIKPVLATVQSVFLLQAWVPISGYMSGVNPPTWTLSIEAFFYLLFPLLIVLVRRRPWLVLVGAVVVSVAGPWIVQATTPLAARDFHEVNWYVVGHFFPTSRLAEFVLGMVAAHWWSSRRRRVLAAPADASIAELMVVAALAFALFGVAQMPAQADLVGSGVADWLTQVAIAPLYALLIIVVAGGKGHLARALNRPLLIRLGEMSFAIYLLHSPMYGVVTRWGVAYGWRTPFVGVVYVAVLLALGWLAWRFVEVPLRAHLLRRGAERPVPEPAA